jgi:uncharacterized phage protein (TIGR01671 family)
MRDILFRGKCNEVGKYNGRWIEGFYAEDDNKPIIVRSTDRGLIGYFCEPNSIGQYTGLTDKNGKKIFEGDCFETCCTGLPVYKHIVGYYSEHFAFMARCIEMNTVHYLSDYRPSAIEVIGNIHDNPELLEVSN